MRALEFLIGLLLLFSGVFFAYNYMSWVPWDKVGQVVLLSVILQLGVYATFGGMKGIND